MPQPALGLALGSGGARGLAHCGVLDVLHAEDVPIDLIAGTSMGAIVGALYARRPDPAVVWKALEAYASDREFSAQWSRFVPHRGDGEDHGVRPWHSLFDFMQRSRIAFRTMTTPSAEGEESLRGPLARLFAGCERFEQLQLPLATVALDLVGGEMVVFQEGSLIDGLYASSAIPGVFPPLERDGAVIVDGGGPYRVPVEACRDLGADFVVAVDIPGYQEANLRSGFALGMRSNAIARDRLNEYVCAGADMVIRPDVGHVHWADFGAAAAVREAGREAARQALPELRRRWRRRQSPLVQLASAVGRRLGGAA